MPSQSASGSSTPIGQLTRMAYPPAEWELLIDLPARVMIAATSAEPHSPSQTVSEGLAGMEAIAAGRASDSDLVRAVVAAIYSRSEDDQPAAEEFTDRAAALAGVLAACGAVTRVLSARADPADSAAYRQWLQHIAARVRGATRAGRVPGPGRERFGADERRFVADLGAALNL
jgi:hypothetical protein